MDFIDFKKFWGSEAEKKLFRCSKEFGIYAQVKKILNPKNKKYREGEIKKIYEEVFGILFLHKYGVIDFSDYDNKRVLTNRKFTVSTAFHSKRHLSLLVIFRILEKIHIDEIKFKKLFEKIDIELFKQHKLSTFFIENWYFIKLFFTKL